MAARKTPTTRKPAPDPVLDGEHDGVSLISQNSALSNARAKASAAGADVEHTQRIVVQDLDAYQSRWSRDPGRANGPYS